jgi:hypothetical protein
MRIVGSHHGIRIEMRIEVRQFYMSRLHPQQWGEKQQIDIKDVGHC